MTEKTVTIKDTKATIFQAYRNALAAANEKASQVFDPVEAEKSAHTNEVLEKSEVVAKTWNVQAFSQLGDQCKNTLFGLQSSFESKFDELKALEESIEARKAELETLYGITNEAQSLAALIESHKQLEEKLGAEHEKRVEARNQELKNLVQEIEAHKAEWTEDRKRMVESWEYDFEREKLARSNQFTDELEAERKEHIQGLEAAEKTALINIEARNKSIDAREEAVAKQEGEHQRLVEVEAGLPERIKAEVGRTMGMERAKHEAEMRIMGRTHEADMQVLKEKNESLQERCVDFQRQIKRLEEKLESAYNNVQSVASKALEAQGSVRTTEAVQQAVASTASSKK